MEVHLEIIQMAEEISIRETLVNGESSGESVQQSGDVAFVEDTVVSETEAVKTNNVTVGQQPSTSSYGDVECLDTTDSEMILDPVAKPVLLGEIVEKSTTVADVVKPLNFEEFNSSAELEVIGMEMLKSELQSRGLKCGGTLQEHAARLFLLKTTPFEKLPKKLLAKK